MITPFLVFSQEVSNTETDLDTPNEEVVKPEQTSTETQSYFIDNSKPEEERVVENSNIADQSYFQENTESEDNSNELEENISSSTSVTELEVPEVITETVHKEEERKPEIIKKEDQKNTTKEKPLSELTRVYEKEIFVNKDAKHHCEAEFFSVDMSQKESTINTIFFTKESEIPYEIEIGSLPIGVDIRFSENNSYYKNLGSTEESIDISIIKDNNALKGNFTVPIIYTQKGLFDSAVICQINIINK